MKTKLVSALLLTVFASAPAYAENGEIAETSSTAVSSKTMLEEIALLRQEQQLEQAKVDMLTVKNKRISLEVAANAPPPEPIADSTSFSGEALDLNPEPPTPPEKVAQEFAQWDVKPVSEVVAPTEPTKPAEPPSSSVRLVDVAGFSNNLKASISVDGAMHTVQAGDKVRGKKISIKKVGFDFVEYIERGKVKTAGFEHEPKAEPLPPPVEPATPSSAFNGMGFNDSTAQPIPMMPN